jgi:hypothetical protein
VLPFLVLKHALQKVAGHANIERVAAARHDVRAIDPFLQSAFPLFFPLLLNITDYHPVPPKEVEGPAAAFAVAFAIALAYSVTITPIVSYFEMQFHLLRIRTSLPSGLQSSLRQFEFAKRDGGRKGGIGATCQSD